MSKFEWDISKNDSNKKKHKISFEKSKEVFNDQNRIIYPGKPNTSNENRFLTVGKIPNCSSIHLEKYSHSNNLSSAGE